MKTFNLLLSLRFVWVQSLVVLSLEITFSTRNIFLLEILKHNAMTKYFSEHNLNFTVDIEGTKV